MTDKKITKRDNFENIRNFLVESGKNDWADVIAHEIVLLDKKAATAKESASKKKAAGDALTDAIFAVLTNEFASIADITAKVVCDGVDITNSKVQYRLNALVDGGSVVKEQIAVPGVDGSKARKVVHYRLAD